MIDKKDIGAIIGLISKLWQEDQKIKAQNEVILKILAKQQGLSLKEVSKDVESIYAQKVLDNSAILDEIINKALDEN
jgi:predicted DsbA family dithiol-disulfide isomerase